MDLTEVKGIGPATAIKLKSAGVDSAEQLANSTVEALVEAGITKNTATKIINSAKEIISSAPVETKETQPKKSETKSDKEIKSVKIPIAYVKGVGPKTRDVLEEGGIISAQDLAKASEDQLVNLGIPAGTAAKIIANAQDQIGDLPEESAKAKTPQKVEKPKEEPKTKVVEKKVEPVEVKPKEEPKVVEKPAPKKEKAKKVEKTKPAVPVAEHERSPMPQGIPTKKKRGVQIRRADEEDADVVEPVEKAEGWVVTARELSEEEIEKRRKRQEEMARSKSITREVPQIIAPVKAVKSGKKTKTEKPVKSAKTAKKTELKQKTEKVKIEFYSIDDLKLAKKEYRIRSLEPTTGQSKPRAQLERDTKLGRISSFRRSRRDINQKQLIVDLNEEFSSDQLVGQKIYFIYPETNSKVPGSISKSFGKSSSKKVIASFSKGIRTDAMNQGIYVK